MNKEYVIFIKEHLHIYTIDVADDELKVESTLKRNLIHNELLITFQPDELINLLGVDGVQRVQILDFECLDKQIRQSTELPIRDEWSIPKMIATYLNKEERKWQEEEYEALLKELALCYREMKHRGTDEWQRIKEIEIPVNKILYDVQAKGFYFNHEMIEQRCHELYRELYKYKNQIQLELNYTGEDLISYLNLHHIEHKLRRFPSDTEYKNICKIQHPELEPFWQVKKVERNLKCLLILSTDRFSSNKCNPIFKGFASSTGRIFLREPALQHLQKKFRILLKENLSEEWRYEYIDFGQFEAGILAGLTKNTKLQELYENDSIYETLAKIVNTDRDTAKIIFYCFVYGGIIQKQAEPFFKSYNLENIVDIFFNQAKENGYVETVFGNKRRVLDDNDKTWAFNHYIQGTSSLIFKQALINVKTAFENKVELILPVHDAALFKVHKIIDTEQLKTQFKNAFTKWIPGSNPIIKVKDFFEEGEQ